MLGSLQTFVQRRFFTLLMLLLAAGFLLIFGELVLYNHFKGLQILGTASTVIGAIMALVGIGAGANLRRWLAVGFIALSLVGVIGVFEHNEERLGGEEERRPPAAQTTGNQASGESGENEQGESEEAGEAGERPEGPGEETPPPPLAPLSLAGFCALGAVALLGRKDPA